MDGEQGHVANCPVNCGSVAEVILLQSLAPNPNKKYAKIRGTRRV